MRDRSPLRAIGNDSSFAAFGICCDAEHTCRRCLRARCFGIEVLCSLAQPEDTAMTNAWKIGTFALVALVAVVALGLNGRAKSNNLPSDDAEMYPQFCSVVDPMSPCFQGYGGLFIWDPY